MSDDYDDDAPSNVEMNLRMRKWQLELFNRLKRFNVLVIHRGAGKTILALMVLIIKAMNGPAHAEYLYLGPLKNQMMRAMWEPLKLLLEPLVAVKAVYINNNRLEIIFFPNRRDDGPGVRARITVLGADEPDTLRGKHLHGLIIDEFGDCPKDTWQIVFPMVTNWHAWVIFIGTPKGRNEFYNKLSEAQRPENAADWLGVVMDYKSTGALDPLEIEAARRTMSADFFAQEYECFPPGSKVTLADNVKAIEFVVPGDLVMTHTGHLRRVDEVMSKLYHGDLVVITAYGTKPIRMTPEHPVYVCDPTKQTYSWKMAKNVGLDDWLVTPKKHIGLPIISSALAELIAWFVSEGCVCHNAIVLSLGSHETTFIQRIVDCFALLGRESIIQTTGAVTNISCYDVSLADFLIASCGSLAFNKRLPLSLIAGHEQLVFDTLIDGDGHVYNDERKPKKGRPSRRTRYTYSTVSETLAMQVQLLAAMLNLAGSYTTKPAGNGIIEGRLVNCRESYTVQMYKVALYDVKNSNYKLRTSKNGSLGKIKSIHSEGYSGPVYNLSVIGDESYLVNNRVVHNCNFEASNSNAYYARQMAELRVNGNIVYDRFLYNPDLEVHCCWDIGMRDYTAIWWFQVVRDHATKEDIIHFIDFEQSANMGLPDWNMVILERERTLGYRRGSMIFPHDIKVREWGANVSRIEAAEKLGIAVEQCPDHGIDDRVELMRLHLPKCKFDGRRCDEGIESLAQYREKVNKMGIGMGVPDKSNGVDHAADAAGYGMLYAKQVMGKPVMMRIPMFRRM